MSSKTTDDALLEDATKAVNAERYQDAIDIINLEMSVGGQARADVKQVLANGYAGKCGLNFVNFVSGLSSSSSGTAFHLMAAPFVGEVVDPSSCLTALSTMDSIGTTAQRTADQNAFTSVVGMALMGTTIRLYTDAAPASTNGDGATDSANIACSLTNAQMDLIILGFGYMAKNFSALSSQQLGSSSQASLSGVISVCSSVPGVTCVVTDQTQISTLLRDTMRDLLNTSDYGIGSVTTNGNPLLLVGACP